VTADLIKSSSALHITGSSLSISENMRNACYKAVNLASRSGIIISFDPNLRAELMNRRTMMKISKPVLNAANVVLPSKQELFDLTGQQSVDDASAKIFKHGAECLIVKLGAQGSIGLNDHGQIIEPGYQVREVDPTGAGDAFDAAVILGYLKKWKFRALLEFANAVGAFKVTKSGPMDVPRSLAQVRAFMRTNKKNIQRKSELI
jgi:sugar/nucleoside kinase (ribokinase family)